MNSIPNLKISIHPNLNISLEFKNVVYQIFSSAQGPIISLRCFETLVPQKKTPSGGIRKLDTL